MAFVESGGGDGSCLNNALGQEQHLGGDHGRIYGRPGYIPGSSNVPSVELTDDETGLYRPAESLLEEAGPDRTRRAVTYCGGDIAASNDASVLSLLGYQDIAVYEVSMSDKPPIRRCRWKSTERRASLASSTGTFTTQSRSLPGVKTCCGLDSFIQLAAKVRETSRERLCQQ